MDNSLVVRRKQPGYLSYLLRLWRVDVGAAGDLSVGSIWRLSIESSLNGERQGFANLDELFVFLLRQIDPTSGEGMQEN
ncbi:MAG: hypothetical protein A2W35_18980 [Chloroflexi bacterium RBG_16_57_11]|nr:MAG: hypothetical protein A2W35_18980 [Chloroflexi bacterium RBG_16_57_11]